MRKLLTTATLLSCGLTLAAQNIDFDLPGKTAPGKDTEINYTSWAVPRAESSTQSFDNGVSITLTPGGAATALGSNWSKTDVETKGLRLIADEVLVTNLVDGNLTQITDAATSLTLTIEGLPPGEHTLKAYHNNSDSGQTQPDIEVSVDGQVVATGVRFTSAAQSTVEAGSSFVTFTAKEGQPVVITYATCPVAGRSYTNTRVMLNGLEFDVASMVASDPQPANHDFHAGSEDGTVTLAWVAAPGAVGHKVVVGTDSLAVAQATGYDYEGSDTHYVRSGLLSSQRYWWRVDEVDADGVTHRGKVWTFQPCQLAFPGAEGYGRYAIGGRGGTVYHVTSLSGGKEPGTLLYGLTEMREPRYIVFDVSGVIELDFTSHFIQPYATIAGQTAPGKGVCIKASNINVGSDVICRHIRFKRGLGVYGENTGNAMGMSGANHAIVDHCTAAWGTDETVSGRGALNVTFQYSVISEALGIAGHKNYADGTNHGYAATIDGRTGSWHHNLLVNCAGRNWSMGGGMDGQNRPIGGLDLFNNVCYNWNSRTTDGNCHAVNFVGNYYKMGPDTRNKTLFTQQFEDAIAPDGIDQAYINGNIRENKDHSLTIDKRGDTYNATGNIPTTYDYVVAAPLFPSYATIHPAEDALKIVASCSGATMPQPDEHHLRNIRETLDGTWTYKGSKSGIKGEIDSEADISEHPGGWEEYPEERRPVSWDTDQDGMPDWWEHCTGSDATMANHNDDPDGDGWTRLEDYLDFMAHPYIMVEPNSQATIDLRLYFAGFFGQNGHEVVPTFSVDDNMGSGLFAPSISGTRLTVRATKPDTESIGRLNVTVSDGATTFSRRFGLAITDGSTAIRSVCCDSVATNPTTPCYDLQGRRVSRQGAPLQKGLYIQGSRKVIIR